MSEFALVGPYAKVFTTGVVVEGSLIKFPLITKALVQEAQRDSRRIQGKVGLTSNMGTSVPEYLRAVYNSFKLTVDHVIPRGDIIGDDMLVHCYDYAGHDDKGRPKTVPGPDSGDPDFHLVQYPYQPGSQSAFMVIGGRVCPGVSYDELVYALSFGDRFLRSKDPSDMPDRTDSTDPADVLDYLYRSRLYRGQFPSMDPLTRVQFIPCGSGFEANKYPTGMDCILTGASHYGSLAGVGNDALIFGKHLNGVSREDLCPDKLAGTGKVVIVNDTVPSEDGMGIGEDLRLDDYVKNIPKAYVETSFENLPFGFSMHGKTKPHNSAVVSSKGIPTAEIGFDRLMETILVANDLRNLVHQGIYGFPEYSKSKRLESVRTTGKRINYVNAGLSTVKKHIINQGQCLVFGRLSRKISSVNDKDAMIKEGLMDIPFDPTVSIPIKAKAYCLGQSKFKTILDNISDLGVTHVQGVNLLRAIRQKFFYDDCYDFKWEMKGAKRRFGELVGLTKLDHQQCVLNIYQDLVRNRPSLEETDDEYVSAEE